MIDKFKFKYAPFSNFHLNSMYLIDDELVYPSNEHAYQAAKTLDLDRRMIIRNAETPGQAKKLGNHKDTILRPDWNIQRRKVMLQITRVKYCYSDLQELLLSTERQQLIEGNYWHDQYWGKCWCDTCNTEGKNWLGKILMMVRLELQIQKGIE